MFFKHLLDVKDDNLGLSLCNAVNSCLQVCPQAADVVELLIYLGEPCHVCELLLTVAHGADDSTYPSTVDVRIGQNLDSLKLVLEVHASLSLPSSGIHTYCSWTVTPSIFH